MPRGGVYTLAVPVADLLDSAKGMVNALFNTPCSKLKGGRHIPPNRSSSHSEHRSWVLLDRVSSWCIASIDETIWWQKDLSCIWTEIVGLFGGVIFSRSRPGTLSILCWAMRYMSLTVHQSQSSGVSSTSSMEWIPPLWLVYETAVELSMFRLTVIWRWFFSNAWIANRAPLSSNTFMCNIFSWADHLPFVLTPLETAPQPIFDASVKIIISGDGGTIGLPFTWRIKDQLRSTCLVE